VFSSKPRRSNLALKQQDGSGASFQKAALALRLMGSIPRMEVSSADATHPTASAGESPRSVIRQVGVVGLGHMGHAFAANLLADGYRVLVCDRDLERIKALEAKGAVAAPQLGDLAGCDAVLTSLPDDEALAAVALGAGGLAAVLSAGAVHVSTSTVSPAASRRVAEAHAGHGQGYVAAPVLGNPDLAQDRKLFVLAAGPSSTVEKVRPILEKLGQRLFVIDEDVGLANLLKLAANVLTATTLECMGEVLALLRKGGLDRHLAFDVLTNSLFDSRVHKTYGGKIVEERFSPAGLSAPLALKDLRLALAEAERTAVPMPAASLVHDHLVAMVARGWTELDWSALGLLAAIEAGLSQGD
jgi:3-hydroxyisobutyrate dehydrogenase-like beta-hydroxyacid dehydrogenase